MTEQAPELPRGLRRASVLALLAGAMLGIISAYAMAQVLEPVDYEALVKADKLTFAGPQDMARAHLAFWKSYDKNLESMRSSRVAILMLLSICTSLLFVSALRMLRPMGVPREGVRRLLAGAAMACAILSTLAGAQSTAAAKKASVAADKVALEEAIKDWIPGLYGVVTLPLWSGFALLIAGSFAGLWMYFKSEGVQAQLSALEKQ